MIDSGNKLLENRIHLFDPVGLINDGYRASNYTSFTDTNSGGLRSYNHSIKDPNNGQVRSYYDHRIEDSKFSNGGGSRFELETTIEDHESDLSTPSLWSSSPTSPKAMAMAMDSPIHTMSPNSKTRAIAKGRRELMDMVRDLPESFYELSLKDIVDQKATMDNINLQEEKKPMKGTTKPKERNKQKKRNKKKIVRSESFDNGKILLKTSVFPFLLGSKKSKKKSLVSNGSFKIAPIPNPQSTTSSGSMKCVEKEWWRRRSSESDRNSRSTGSSSSRSSSSNQRHRIRFLPSCCFFNGRRIKGKK